MEEHFVCDRARLRQLWRDHPDWNNSQLAEALHRSLSFVKKWLKRLKAAHPDDQTVLRSLPRRRKILPLTALADPVLVEQTLDLRDNPPQDLNRTPGPRTLLYYLKQRAAEFGLALGLKVPRSTRTIWKIPRHHGRILKSFPKLSQPWPRFEPLVEWQLDFKDVGLKFDPNGPNPKKQHLVECLNIECIGTSLWLGAHVKADFNAETILAAVVKTLREYGLPRRVTFDRDTRFVGSYTGRDFPSAFIRLWHCLGVQVNLCPPHRPDLNGFVERLNKTLGQECYAIKKPQSEQEAAEVTAHFQHFYNHKRPHQGRSCGNRPPRVAFPELPQRPALPAKIDPDGWVKVIDGQKFVRRVNQNGSLALDKAYYYVKKELAGQSVIAEIDGHRKELVIYHQFEVVKRMPIKGLFNRELPFEEFVSELEKQARSEERQRQLARSGQLG